ncbi:MAG: ISAs1 family transposase, partial [Psychromonas sp.]|nr:ISAs1 family transposase [Psychromonas sp.]
MQIDITYDHILLFIAKKKSKILSKPLFTNLSLVSDPRQQGKVKHKLLDILFLIITAVISGADTWEEIEDFGLDKLIWLRKYLPFKKGMPTHDTIARVMGLLDPKEFQLNFANWMSECCELIHGDVIAIDGKSLRGSFTEITDKDGKTGMLHVVSAFCAKHSVSLGQVTTDIKSNEITSIPKLLDLLDIRGCLITIDAMGCKTKIAQKIIDKGGDYLLAVKGYQGRLHGALKNVFNAKRLEENPLDVFTTQD